MRMQRNQPKIATGLPINERNMPNYWIDLDFPVRVECPTCG
jgi:hypothetical protein